MINVEVIVTIPQHMDPVDFQTFRNVMETLNDSYDCDERDKHLALRLSVVTVGKEGVFTVGSSKDDADEDEPDTPEAAA